jgi:hypothetical protein
MIRLVTQLMMVKAFAFRHYGLNARPQSDPE